MSFVHLHVHTAEGSLLDGACRIQELIAQVKALGMSAVAITDHGAMYGAIDFYKAAKDAGVKPIIGCEVYVAPRGRSDRVHGIDDKNQHLILLCENETGYKNLCCMVSEAYIHGFYKKPRIDKELLKAHHEGLICLSACLAGEIPRILIGADEPPAEQLSEAQRYAEAKEAALFYKELFGDRYYLEMQDHGIEEQTAVNRGLRKLSRELEIPLVITNDAHYIQKDDAYAQEILMCMQTQKTILDPTHMKFATNEFYIKSEEEMLRLFPDDISALENTKKIADRCNLNFEFGHYHLPEFLPPAEYETADAYFETLCWKGYAERYPEDKPEDRAQMEYEISMIRQMGFVNYFLIVADYIGWAKSQDIPVGPGRGSAAGSMVSYCMHITNLDPRKYGLYFERFLNPERVSMPDIDVDFCVERREEVIRYVAEKYGADHVAQIVTFGTLKAKNAIRSVGKAMGLPYDTYNRIAKMIPDNDLHITLDSALQKNPELLNVYQTSKDVKDLIDLAKKVENMPKNTSTHAAAVVIASAPVYEFVPLSRDKENVNGLPVIQYNMTTVEELGLLKMDFLGLRNLTVIHDAQQRIRKIAPSFDVQKIDEQDAKVFAMLSRGDTFGVFQMESAGMTGVCVDLKPQSIEDLTAIVALYRPGPMDSIPTFVNSKRHPEAITYITPQLEPILKVTYGCIVYQEQVIEIFRQLGGYSLGQADNIRRAISKKKEQTILAERETFVHGSEERGIPGAVRNGVTEAAANQIYDEIVSFASYAFNKAHAVCYAYIAYQTAYLKCYYPVEYMAALMTSVLDNKEKLTEYIMAARESGIAVLPPDVNRSGDGFAIEDGAIRFPLNAIAGVGTSVFPHILRRRGDGFSGFTDFMNKTSEIASKSVYEGCIYAGALDTFGLARSQMLAACGDIVSGIKQAKKRNVDGQLSMFDSEDARNDEGYVIPEVPEMPRRILLSKEKSALGIYLSGHPFDDYAPYTKEFSTTGQVSAWLESLSEGQKGQPNTKAAGIITGVKEKFTKKGAAMCEFTLEDSFGSLQVLAFSKSYMRYKNTIREETAVAVTGQIYRSEGNDPVFALSAVMPLDAVMICENKRLYLNVPTEMLVRNEVLSLFEGNVGTTNIYFCEKTQGKSRVFQQGYHSVNIAAAKKLHELLEPEAIVVR